MTSPTQRSLALLRSRGWRATVVEHWNPHACIRQDLLGFGDLLAMRGPSLFGWPHPSLTCKDDENRAIALVQTTTGSNMAARRAKIIAEVRARDWVIAGGRIYLHGWRQIGKANTRRKWECREEQIGLADFGFVIPVSGATVSALEAAGCAITTASGPEHAGSKIAPRGRARKGA